MSFLALFDDTNFLSLDVLLENYVETRLAQLIKDEIYCRVLLDGDNDNISWASDLVSFIVDQHAYLPMYHMKEKHILPNVVVLPWC